MNFFGPSLGGDRPPPVDPPLQQHHTTKLVADLLNGHILLPVYQGCPGKWPINVDVQVKLKLFRNQLVQYLF